MNWNTLAATYDWNSMDGPKEYAWDGYDWVLVSDHGAEVRHSTAIIETDKEITLMAQAQATMNTQLVENTAQLTVQANQIASEVTQRVNSESQLSSRITQNAQSITAEVTRATETEDSLGTRITQTVREIDLKLLDKYGIVAGITINNSGIALTAQKDISLSAGSEITLNSQASINIKSGADLTIASGGKFQITSTNFNIDDSGNVSMTGRITSTAGTIGGWNIGANSLSSGSGMNFIALDNSNPSVITQPVIYAGGSGTNAPFYVTRGGALNASLAVIKGNITVDSITFSSGVTMNGSNLTDGTIGGTKITDGAVSRVKTSSGVQTSLDNGDTARARLDSLMAGSIYATDICTNNTHTRKLYVDTGAGYKQAMWRQRRDGDGNWHFYLGD